jgi:nucleoside-diphosphate kinase
MIKPDAVADKVTGKIITMIEEADFEIVAMKKTTFSKAEAAAFYDVHKEKPFFDELVTFLTSGPVIALVLECDGAIAKWRELMGALKPEDQADGTIRKLYAKNIGENAVHGSDAPETAKREIAQIFPCLSCGCCCE